MKSDQKCVEKKVTSVNFDVSLRVSYLSYVHLLCFKQSVRVPYECLPVN